MGTIYKDRAFSAAFDQVKQASAALLTEACGPCSIGSDTILGKRVFGGVLPARIHCRLSRLSPEFTTVALEISLDVARIGSALPTGKALLILPGSVLSLWGIVVFGMYSAFLGGLMVAAGIWCVAVWAVAFYKWSSRLERADKIAVDFCEAFWTALRERLRTEGVPSSALSSSTTQFMWLNLLLGALLLFALTGLWLFMSTYFQASFGTRFLSLLLILALFAFLFLPFAVFQCLRASAFRYEWKRHYFVSIGYWSAAVSWPLWGYLLFPLIRLMPHGLAEQTASLLWFTIILFEYGMLAFWLSYAVTDEAEVFSKKRLPSSMIEGIWVDPKSEARCRVARGSLYVSWLLLSAVLLLTTIAWTTMLAMNTYCWASRSPLMWPSSALSSLFGCPIKDEALWAGNIAIVICLPPVVSSFSSPLWNAVQRLRIRRTLPKTDLSDMLPRGMQELREVRRKAKDCLGARFLWLVCGSPYSRSMIGRISLTRRDYVITVSKLDLCRPEKEIEAIVWHECGHVAYGEKRRAFHLLTELLPWGNTFRWLCVDSIEEELWCDEFCLRMMGGDATPLRRVLSRIEERADGLKDDATQPPAAGEAVLAWRALARLLGGRLSPYYHPHHQIRLACIEKREQEAPARRGKGN